jgi:predicted aldo/keto reductase-like oxidoreductase
MIRHAIDHGVNYLDTAYVYERSEEVLGRALRNGYRERVYIATKSPLWQIQSFTDFEQYLDEQLNRLGTSYVDIYLLHNLYTANIKRAQCFDGFGFLHDMTAKGKIRFMGFSMHNTVEAFEQITEDYYWDMAQIQLNILDAKQQVGLRGLRFGAARGLAMVIMEPLRGGGLLAYAPAKARKLIERYPEKRTLAEWCFRWLYDMPEVSVVLSGTSTLEQLKDNLRVFEQAECNVLSEADQDFIGQIQDAFSKNYSVNCTGCRYCLPCPQNVDIPTILATYNRYLFSEKTTINDRVYYQKSLVGNARGADRCISCNLCRDRCPQSLTLSALLSQAHEVLGQSLETGETKKTVATPY